jgi:short chain dehydrogenase
LKEFIRWKIATYQAPRHATLHLVVKLQAFLKPRKTFFSIIKSPFKMVSLPIVQSSNSLISSTLPSKLVAVFIGATSGIGAITLKTFAKYIVQPRIYFVGRSQEGANLIFTDLNRINADGEYTFIKADVSLLRNVGFVCAQIKEKEKSINLLFLSCGVASFDRSRTLLKINQCDQTAKETQKHQKSFIYWQY